jgi:hypothetical protein
MEYLVARRSFGLCAGELDCFAPLLGIVSMSLPKSAAEPGSTMPPRSAKLHQIKRRAVDLNGVNRRPAI